MKYTRKILTEFIHSEMSKQIEKKMFVHNEINGEVFFRKNYIWGWDYFSLNRILFLETHLEFGINFTRRYSFVEDIWDDLASLINCQSNKLSPTIIIQHSNASEEIKQMPYYNGSLRFEISEQGLAQIPGAIEFVMNKIFEKLDLFLDIKELDKHINTHFQFDEQLHSVIYWEGLVEKRITIAKFANNPNYEALCDSMRSSFSWYIENGKMEGQEYFLNYPVVFEKVYERLKETKPLVNTILSDQTIV